MDNLIFREKYYYWDKNLQKTNIYITFAPKKNINI